MTTKKKSKGSIVGALLGLMLILLYYTSLFAPLIILCWFIYKKVCWALLRSKLLKLPEDFLLCEYDLSELTNARQDLEKTENQHKLLVQEGDDAGLDYNSDGTFSRRSNVGKEIMGRIDTIWEKKVRAERRISRFENEIEERWDDVVEIVNKVLEDDRCCKAAMWALMAWCFARLYYIVANGCRTVAEALYPYYAILYEGSVKDSSLKSSPDPIGGLISVVGISALASVCAYFIARACIGNRGLSGFPDKLLTVTNPSEVPQISAVLNKMEIKNRFENVLSRVFLFILLPVSLYFTWLIYQERVRSLSLETKKPLPISQTQSTVSLNKTVLPVERPIQVERAIPVAPEDEHTRVMKATAVIPSDHTVMPIIQPTVSQPPTQELPTLKVWGPKDKLPRNIEGQLLAGNFSTFGEDINGGLVLVPSVDGPINAFSRKFIVITRTSGLPRNSCFPNNEQTLVQIPSDKPLIFVRRGSIGEYIVKDQQTSLTSPTPIQPGTPDSVDPPIRVAIPVQPPAETRPTIANIKRLTTSEISSLSLLQVQTAINEIYARNGSEFPKREVQSWADSQPWYHRVPGRTQEMAESLFTPDEKFDLELLAARRASLKEHSSN